MRPAAAVALPRASSYRSGQPVHQTRQLPVPRLARRFPALLALAGATACASVGSSPSSAFDATTPPASSPVAERGEPACDGCDGAIPMPTEVTRAVEARIADLKQRGGTCSQYGAVLERSYRSGRITMRPYMWRVGSHLASGEAKPDGEMMLAREIDSLNVGVRTVDDVLWSMEHEAVHIALNVPSGVEASEEQANGYVRACKADAPPARATGARHDSPRR